MRDFKFSVEHDGIKIDCETDSLGKQVNCEFQGSSSNFDVEIGGGATGRPSNSPFRDQTPNVLRLTEKRSHLIAGGKFGPFVYFKPGVVAAVYRGLMEAAQGADKQEIAIALAESLACHFPQTDGGEVKPRDLGLRASSPIFLRAAITGWADAIAANGTESIPKAGPGGITFLRPAEELAGWREDFKKLTGRDFADSDRISPEEVLTTYLAERLAE